jgi:hypothetical protein
MFRGVSGSIQADAQSVYEALFRGRPSQGAATVELSQHRRKMRYLDRCNVLAFSTRRAPA